MIKLEVKNAFENNDGRKDVILRENNDECLIIRESFYLSLGLTYEEMQTSAGLAKFFCVIGLAFNSVRLPAKNLGDVL